MKTKLFFLLLLASVFAGAQTAITLTAKTGDKEMDANLTEINATAKLDPGGFKAQITADFKLPATKIDLMLSTMAPADVFMNAQVAVIIGKPVDDVIVVYNKSKGKGWGVIAKELGIKPGSKEFHQLKDATKSKNAKYKEKAKGKSKIKTTPVGKSTLEENKGKGKGKK